MQIKINFANKSLPADVHVRIRGRVVQVPVEQPRIGAIVPVATKLGKRAPYTPFIFQYVICICGGGVPHTLSKEEVF